MQSTGPAKADYSGWALFIEEGGDDQYQSKEGFGVSSEQGVGAFFDLKGHDIYALPEAASADPDHRPSNGRSTVYPAGGLFVDR
jgi:hypothetical protein